MLEELKKQIMGLPLVEWNDLYSWVVSDEKQRRDTMPAVERAEFDLVNYFQEAGVVTRPKAATEDTAEKAPAWVDPGTDPTKMYHPGDVVKHGGKVWVSRTAGLNSWEPGGAGVHEFIWEDITPKKAGDDDSEWKPNMDVRAGDEVTYQGKTYRVLQAHKTANEWKPNEVPALFEEVK